MTSYFRFGHVRSGSVMLNVITGFSSLGHVR